MCRHIYTLAGFFFQHLLNRCFYKTGWKLFIWDIPWAQNAYNNIVQPKTMNCIKWRTSQQFGIIGRTNQNCVHCKMYAYANETSREHFQCITTIYLFSSFLFLSIAHAPKHPTGQIKMIAYAILDLNYANNRRMTRIFLESLLPVVKGYAHKFS